MKHFLHKTNEHYLCLFFRSGCTISDLYGLLGKFHEGLYKYDDGLPLYDTGSGVIITASEGTNTHKGAVSYPDNYEGYDYICIQFNLVK